MGFLKTTWSVDRPTCVSIHKALNSSLGIICCHELSGMMEMKIKMELQEQGVADLFSLRSWCRKLHIWSLNYTSTLALHKLCKWLRFGYTIATSVIRSSFLMRSYFLTQPPCSKGMWARLWYVHIKSCNSDAGFGANIGSERSRNSLQLVKMSESKKRAYETSSEETKC